MLTCKQGATGQAQGPHLHPLATITAGQTGHSDFDAALRVSGGRYQASGWQMVVCHKAVGRGLGASSEEASLHRGGFMLLAVLAFNNSFQNDRSRR